MHRYIPNTEEQQREMLNDIGLESLDDLFAYIPEDIRLKRPLSLDHALSETEVIQNLKALAGQNADTENHTCFLGAGAYDHFIPAVVDSLLSRQEFYTAYTPYQPEVSQGTLQAIFEYQSMICMLTGMDVANASMYDGASALAEASLIACRETRRSTILAARSVHPQSRETLRTYARFQDVTVKEYGVTSGAADLADIESQLSSGDIAAVVIQTPNFFGIIEDIAEIGRMAHAAGALLVVCCDPIALALLRAPGDLGADIVVGEGQALGISLSYGGPYLGFFAAKEKLLRKMPGRIVGRTVDRNDNPGFVLTMQTREQHIRREKATSNICSNEALCALAATIYLTAMGPKGLHEAAVQCLSKAKYAHDALIGTGLFTPLFNKPFFKEFALTYKGDVTALNNKLLTVGIIGGYELQKDYPEYPNAWLVAVTEKRTKTEIDALLKAVTS
jgi:glycine dehydrogenase subunit 1